MEVKAFNSELFFWKKVEEQIELHFEDVIPSHLGNDEILAKNQDMHHYKKMDHEFQN